MVFKTDPEIEPIFLPAFVPVEPGFTGRADPVLGSTDQFSEVLEEKITDTVDNKINAICQKVKRERAKKRAEREASKVLEKSSIVVSGGGESCSGSDLGSFSSVSEEGFWKGEDLSPGCSFSGEVAGEGDAEMDDWSLARMPSYDLDSIWEVLAN
ncbi:DNA-binding domain-containing protein [Artemisia annua]|uniref:DNA-binding domain-containing protein n=1 Tax=Artemisia annua TaxID=35608 RepID=A0A2U1PJV3_ARTAN|nr:DNA-binding domain-containing protein [Artemisia annua]